MAAQMMSQGGVVQVVGPRALAAETSTVVAALPGDAAN